MSPKGSSWSCYRYLGLKPYFGVIEIVLGTLAHVDAGSLLVQRVVAMKPKDQRTVGQHFGGHGFVRQEFGMSTIFGLPYA